MSVHLRNLNALLSYITYGNNDLMTMTMTMMIAITMKENNFAKGNHRC